MTAAQAKPRLSMRLGIALIVVLLHAVMLVILIRAFAPQVGEAAFRPLTTAFNIAVPPPPPPPPAPDRPRQRPAAARASGASGAAGRRSTPHEISAPQPSLILSPTVAATDAAIDVGTNDTGLGTGAGGSGQGPGAGGSGAGAGGGGGAVKAVKLAGDIVSARDYPKATRDLRLGSSVSVALTVGLDGRVSDCRVMKASRDAQADRITCELASRRFRFRPARNAVGEPIVSVYGWQQRWFTPPSQ